jgi:putative transposase
MDAYAEAVWNMADYERVQTLLVGDVKHIRDNRNHGKVGNQKLHNFWPFVQIRQGIQELGQEYRIRVRFKSERNTSKQCSIYGRKHANGRIRRGLYKCERLATMNADVNGAYNILYGRKVAVVSGSRPCQSGLPNSLLKWSTQHRRASAA